MATQWISLRRANIVDFHHNGICPIDLITVTIPLRRQLPAVVTLRPSSSSRAYSIEILRHGRVVAGIIVKATSGGSGIAVWGLPICGSISVKVVRKGRDNGRRHVEKKEGLKR